MRMRVGEGGGLGALCGGRRGEVCAQAGLVAMVDRAMEEGILVGNSRGYHLNQKLKESLWAFYQGLPYDTTASMTAT